MEEREWLTSDDPTAMLTHLVGNGLSSGSWIVPHGWGWRKLRLLAVAWVRTIWEQLTPGMRDVVEMAERLAEGLAVDEDVYAANARERTERAARNYDRETTVQMAVLVSRCASNHTWSGAFVASQTLEYLLYMRYRQHSSAPHIANLLRDVMGNPFRSQALGQFTTWCANCSGVGFMGRREGPLNWLYWLPCPECGGGGGKLCPCPWLTPQVVSMAQVAYDERDWGILPVLADLLESLGCTRQDMLDHMRSDLPHVRGCWPIDLILGKE